MVNGEAPRLRPSPFTSHHSPYLRQIAPPYYLAGRCDGCCHPPPLISKPHVIPHFPPTLRRIPQAEPRPAAGPLVWEPAEAAESSPRSDLRVLAVHRDRGAGALFRGWIAARAGGQRCALRRG